MISIVIFESRYGIYHTSANQKNTYSHGEKQFNKGLIPSYKRFTLVTMASNTKSTQTTPFSISLFGEMLADIFPQQTVIGGAPYNVARHLHAFAQHATLITRLGNDDLKDIFLSVLQKAGMDTSGIQLDETHPTGRVMVHMVHHGHHRFEICADQAYDYIDKDLAQTIIANHEPDLVYFGTLSQRNTTSRATLEGLLSNAAYPKFLDVNLRTDCYNKQIIQQSLHDADIVKLNDEELNIICDLFMSNHQSNSDKALFLIKNFKLSRLYITCGETGAWSVCDRGIELCGATPTLNKPFIDSVGAGDGFTAVCILGHLYQWPTELTLSRANQFAAEVCSIQGATPNSTGFYAPFLIDWQL